uniref:Uncharacterized protein n=1 Tax=Lepeophtheirus salmonis TaxID=72036 RepID=A0A0K2U8B1_LEPSM
MSDATDSQQSQQSSDF